MSNSEKRKKKEREREINDKRISTRDNSTRFLRVICLQPVRLINRLSIKAQRISEKSIKKKKNWERVIAPEVSRNSNLSYRGA